MKLYMNDSKHMRNYQVLHWITQRC